MHKLSFDYYGTECIFEIDKFSSSSFSVVGQMGDICLSVFICIDKISSNATYINKNVKLVYMEKFYSFDSIPYSRTRREYHNTDREVLISRLIDRSVRPCIKFNDSFIEISILLMNGKRSNDVGFFAILITNIALKILLQDNYIFSIPTKLEVVNNNLMICSGDLHKESACRILFTNTHESIMMIDLSSTISMPHSMVWGYIYGAFNTAKSVIKELEEKIQAVIQERLERGVAILEMNTFNYLGNDDLEEYVYMQIENLMKCEQRNASKTMKLCYERIQKYLIEDQGYNPEDSFISVLINSVCKKMMFEFYSKTGKRIDGRSFNELRPLSVNMPFKGKTGLQLSRGDTTVMSFLTLGNDQDKLITEEGIVKNFFVHYNFYAFSADEFFRAQTIKRRDLGHGNIIESALEGEIFIFSKTTVRVVVDVMSANGSTSMAGCMASSLLCHIVGVSKQSAGILVGMAIGCIVSDDKKLIVLADINLIEDELGEMDFKIAGRSDDGGITFIQMDSKSEVLTLEILQKVFELYSKSSSTYAQVLNDFKKNGDKQDVKSYKREKIFIGNAAERMSRETRKLEEKLGVQIVISKKQEALLAGYYDLVIAASEYLKEYAKALINNN